MKIKVKDIDAELEALVTKETIAAYRQTDDKKALCRLLLVNNGLGLILADCLEEELFKASRNTNKEQQQ